MCNCWFLTIPNFRNYYHNQQSFRMYLHFMAPGPKSPHSALSSHSESIRDSWDIPWPVSISKSLYILLLVLVRSILHFWSKETFFSVYLVHLKSILFVPMMIHWKSGGSSWVQIQRCLDFDVDEGVRPQYLHHFSFGGSIFLTVSEKKPETPAIQMSSLNAKSYFGGASSLPKLASQSETKQFFLHQ